MMDCFDKLHESHGDRLGKKELLDIVRDVKAKREAARAANIADVDAYVTKLAKREVDEATFNKVMAKRRALIQATTTAKNVNGIDRVWGDAPEVGIEALLIGVNRNVEGARDSLWNAHALKRGEYVDKLEFALRDADGSFWDLLQTHTLDDEISEAAFVLNNPQALKRLDQRAVGIAHVVDRVNEFVRAEKNKAGAHVGYYNGFLVRNAHDMYRIAKSGKDAWVDYMMDGRIDLARSFGTQDESVARSILGELWRDFSTGNHMKDDAGDIIAKTVQRVRGGSVANALSHHRGLHWTSGKAMMDYQRQYGMGTLIEAIATSLQTSGRKVALMQRLGPGDPHDALDNIIDATIKNREAGGADALKLRNADWRNSMHGHLARITGELDVPQNHIVERVKVGTLAYNALTKLGSMVFSAFPDLANMNLVTKWTNKSPLAGLTRGLSALVTVSKDQERVARMSGAMIDGIRNSLSDVTDGYGRPGVMAYTLRKFFDITLMTRWTNRLRIGYVAGVASDLAGFSKDSFSNLPSDTQILLRSAGLERDWDTMRSAAQLADDGRSYISAEHIKDVGVANRYRAMLRDLSNSAVVEAGPRTKAITRGRAQAGTPDDILRALFMQFKTFPIAILENVVGRELTMRSDKAGFFAAAKDSSKSWAIPLAFYMVQATSLGYLALVMKDIAKNRTPRELDGVALKQAMLQGGAMGIFGDFLMGEGLKNRHGGSFAETLAGPTAGTVSGFANLYGRFIAGDDTASTAVKTLYSSIPGNNLWFLKAIVETMFLNGLYEHLNPGYTARQRARMLRDTGQTPWIE
jgi:hypothetical protein